MHLVVAAALLAARDVINQALLMSWPGLNHLVCYLGMAWLAVAAPFPPVVLVGWRIGVKREEMDRCWKICIAGLLRTGILVLLLESRRLKQTSVHQSLLPSVNQRVPAE